MDRAVRGIQTASPMLPQPVNISDVPFAADQQVGPLQLTQEPVQRVLFLRLLQLADQLRRCEEPHPQTCPTRSLPQGHSDVRFSSSVTPNKTTIVLLFNPLAS